MANLRMRPRFAVDVACEASSVVRELQEHVEAAGSELEGFFSEAHCVLRIPAARRMLWSPELDITFEPLPQAGIRIRCLLRPSPPVWTGFAFVYALSATAAVAGLVWALAQLTLGAAPWALWASAAALAVIAGVYVGNYVGQGLAASQMYELRRAFDECVERADARPAPRTALDSARL